MKPRRMPAAPLAGFWRTVARFAIVGPLLGGWPYNLLLLPIPFSYALGLLPASLCGLGFALWWHAPQRHPPGWVWRGGMGALFGLLGCAAAALVVELAFGPRAGPHILLFASVLALHGLVAGMVLGLVQPPIAATRGPVRLQQATCP